MRMSDTVTVTMNNLLTARIVLMEGRLNLTLLRGRYSSLSLLLPSPSGFLWRLGRLLLATVCTSAPGVGVTAVLELALDNGIGSVVSSAGAMSSDTGSP